MLWTCSDICNHSFVTAKSEENILEIGLDRERDKKYIHCTYISSVLCDEYEQKEWIKWEEKRFHFVYSEIKCVKCEWVKQNIALPQTKWDLSKCEFGKSRKVLSTHYILIHAEQGMGRETDRTGKSVNCIRHFYGFWMGYAREGGVRGDVMETEPEREWVNWNSRLKTTHYPIALSIFVALYRSYRIYYSRVNYDIECFGRRMGRRSVVRCDASILTEYLNVLKSKIRSMCFYFA